MFASGYVFLDKYSRLGRRVPYTSSHQRHASGSLPNQHGLQPKRNQQQPTRDQLSVPRIEREFVSGQHSGRQHGPPVQGQRNSVRGRRLPVRGAWPAGGRQQNFRCQQQMYRGGLKFRSPGQAIRGHHQLQPRHRWLSTTGQHHQRNHFSSSDEHTCTRRSDSPCSDRKSRSVSQEGHSSLDQLINQAVEKFLTLDTTTPATLESVQEAQFNTLPQMCPTHIDASENANTEEESIDSRKTKSGKPSRWDVRPVDESPCSVCACEEETESSVLQKSEGHVEERLLDMSGSMDRQDPMQAINQITEKLRTLTNALPTPSKDALAALTPLPLPASPEHSPSSSLSIGNCPKSLPVKLKDHIKQKKKQPTADFIPQDMALSGPQQELESTLKTREQLYTFDDVTNIDVEHVHQPLTPQKRVVQIVNVFSQKGTPVKAPGKTVRYEPTQTIPTVEPTPGRRIIMIKSKCPVSEQMPDTRIGKRSSACVPVTSSSGSSDRRLLSPVTSSSGSSDRRLVKFKSHKKSFKAILCQVSPQSEDSDNFPTCQVEEETNRKHLSSETKEIDVSNEMSEHEEAQVHDTDSNEKLSGVAHNIDVLPDTPTSVTKQSQFNELDLSHFYHGSKSEEHCISDLLPQKCSETQSDTISHPVLVNTGSATGLADDAEQVQVEGNPLGTTWHPQAEYHDPSPLELGFSQQVKSSLHVDGKSSVDKVKEVTVSFDTLAVKHDFVLPSDVCENTCVEKCDSNTTAVTTVPCTLSSDHQERFCGAGMSRQTRVTVPAIKKAKKGSVTNLNEREKLKALFSVRKRGGLKLKTKSDCSGAGQIQQSKSDDSALDMVLSSPPDMRTDNAGTRQEIESDSIEISSLHMALTEGIIPLVGIEKLSLHTTTAEHVPQVGSDIEKSCLRTAPVEHASQVGSSIEKSSLHAAPAASQMGSGVEKSSLHTDPVEHASQMGSCVEKFSLYAASEEPTPSVFTMNRVATEHVSPVSISAKNSSLHQAPVGHISQGLDRIQPHRQAVGGCSVSSESSVLTGQSWHNDQYIDDEEILREIDSCLESPVLHDDVKKAAEKASGNEIVVDSLKNSDAIATSGNWRATTATEVDFKKSQDADTVTQRTGTERDPSEQKRSNSESISKARLPDVLPHQSLTTPERSTLTAAATDLTVSDTEKTSVPSLVEFTSGGQTLKRGTVDQSCSQDIVPNPGFVDLSRDSIEPSTAQTQEQTPDVSLEVNSVDRFNTGTTSSGAWPLQNKEQRTLGKPPLKCLEQSEPTAGILKEIESCLYKSGQEYMKPPKPVSSDAPLQSCLRVDQDPSGTTDINISVAITADNENKNGDRPDGGTLSHVANSVLQAIALDSTASLVHFSADTAADISDEDDFVTTCISLSVPRKQALKICFEPVVRSEDLSGNKDIEVEITAETESSAQAIYLAQDPIKGRVTSGDEKKLTDNREENICLAQGNFIQKEKMVILSGKEGLVIRRQTTDAETLECEEENNREQPQCLRPSNTVAVEPCVRTVAMPALSPAATAGNLYPNSVGSSPTSPPSLTQWDQCDMGSPNLSGSPPHLEPQTLLSSPRFPTVYPCNSPKPALLGEHISLDGMAENENPLAKIAVHGGHCECSSSNADSSCCSARACNQHSEKPLVVGLSPSDLDTHMLPAKNTMSVSGELAVCPVSEDGDGVDAGVSCVPKHTVPMWKSCIHPDLSPASRTMPVPVTITSTQETMESDVFHSGVDGK